MPLLESLVVIGCAFSAGAIAVTGDRMRRWEYLLLELALLAVAWATAIL